jgi:hypothetical protein
VIPRGPSGLRGYFFDGNKGKIFFHFSYLIKILHYLCIIINHTTYVSKTIIHILRE